MKTGKVMALYMTMPDMMRSGHRMAVEDFECDPDGILEDMNYESSQDYVMMLTSLKSYELVEEAELVIAKGVLMENIIVDIDLYGLKKGSVIELGDTLLEVTGPCESYGYLMALAPELPDILRGNRGLFVRPLDHGRIELGDEVKVLKDTSKTEEGA